MSLAYMSKDKPLSQFSTTYPHASLSLAAFLSTRLPGDDFEAKLVDSVQKTMGDYSHFSGQLSSNMERVEDHKLPMKRVVKCGENVN